MRNYITISRRTYQVSDIADKIPTYNSNFLPGYSSTQACTNIHEGTAATIVGFLIQNQYIIEAWYYNLQSKQKIKDYAEMIDYFKRITGEVVFSSRIINIGETVKYDLVKKN